MQNQLNKALKILDQEGFSVNRCTEGEEYLIDGVMTEKQIIATAEVMSSKEMEFCVADYEALDFKEVGCNSTRGANLAISSQGPQVEIFNVELITKWNDEKMKERDK